MLNIDISQFVDTFLTILTANIKSYGRQSDESSEIILKKIYKIELYT